MMLLEMHSHTSERSACSGISAVDLVRQVLSRNLQGLVITDHHYLWGEKELAALRQRSGAPGHFLILSAQEVSTSDMGHVLVYGAGASIREGTSVREIRRDFPGAALVLAHPYRGRRRPSREDLCSPLIDAVEIFSSNHSMKGNWKGLRDWHRWKFTAVGGTDSHGQVQAGTCPTQLDHPVSTAAALADEIREGRCRPFFKEIVKAGANDRVTEITIGTKGRDERRPRIVIRRMRSRREWVRADRISRLTDEISRHGFDAGRYRVPKILGRDAAHLTLIEEGERGKTLFEKLVASDAGDGMIYLVHTARWLAQLHSLKLRLSPPEEFPAREEDRLANYGARFEAAGLREAALVKKTSALILELERRIIAGAQGKMVQGHGDFHPKNVIVGQEHADDRESFFIAAVDLENSTVLPPAFDVGWFLAQFRYQFARHPPVLERYPEELFLESYREGTGMREQDFDRQVELFRARTNLSIAAYLVKLGLGETAECRALISEMQGLVE